MSSIEWTHLMANTIVLGFYKSLFLETLTLFIYSPGVFPSANAFIEAGTSYLRSLPVEMVSIKCWVLAGQLIIRQTKYLWSPSDISLALRQRSLWSQLRERDTYRGIERQRETEIDRDTERDKERDRKKRELKLKCMDKHNPQ